MTSDSESMPAAKRPRTLTVLLFLVLAAATFSYLGAYAIPRALVSTDVVRRWPATADPRPHWMLTQFALLTALFASVAFVFRIVSRRQLRRIDAIGDDAGLD